MKRPRDSQRAKVYRSDAALNEFSIRYDDMDQLRGFVHRVWYSAAVQKEFAVARKAGWKAPVVDDGRGRRRAGGNAWGISMPRWSRSTGIILHELAHTIQHREKPWTQFEGHGWRFCEIYARLTLFVMGDDAHAALIAAFKKNKVKYQEPKERKPVSPQKREELIARLAKARAAKKTKETSLAA